MVPFRGCSSVGQAAAGEARFRLIVRMAGGWAGRGRWCGGGQHGGCWPRSIRGAPGRRKSSGWIKDPPRLEDGDDVVPVPPERLTVLYRSLRKAFEEAKNEAGAGDFYYGGMEARRHSPSTSRMERALLTIYWMISGYGQRASRALRALVV